MRKSFQLQILPSNVFVFEKHKSDEGKYVSSGRFVGSSILGDSLKTPTIFEYIDSSSLIYSADYYYIEPYKRAEDNPLFVFSYLHDKILRLALGLNL